TAFASLDDFPDGQLGLSSCLFEILLEDGEASQDNLLLTADQKRVKLVDFGLAREETLTEMMTAETGTYRWMAPELYSTVTLRQGEKKHYNHKVDAYSFAIVLWELLTNRMPFERMSNLQAAYAAAFKNVRPSSEDLPEELASILHACWAEDPNIRPNFIQIVRRLSAYLSSLTVPEDMPPPLVIASKNSILPPESPGTSSLMTKQGNQNEDGKSTNTSRGCLPCFSSHWFRSDAENGLIE
ncbi:hypothetical protein KI387_028358, partial [Taxus chinensis]